MAQAVAKLRELIRVDGDAIKGPWDGEEAITLMADLDAGATGAMTGGGYPAGIAQIMRAHAGGDRAGAQAAYAMSARSTGRRCPLMRVRGEEILGAAIGTSRAPKRAAATHAMFTAVEFYCYIAQANLNERLTKLCARTPELATYR